jgi:transposase
MTGAPPIPEELWSTIPPVAQAVVAVVFSELNGRVATLEARVKELEVRLGQNSSNSSKPPSSDPPHVKPAPSRKPSGKKKGGQPGHPKRPRPQLPPDRIVELKSDFCDGCDTPLSGDDANPLVHQVIEIPPPKPEVVEYRQHRRCCPHCDRVSYPLLPDDARQGFGPRVQAIAALLSGGYRLGKRAVAKLLGDLFGVPSSVGVVCKLQHRTTAALEPVAREVSTYLAGRPANVDETEWVEGREKGWLWTVVTRWVTAFQISRTRSKVTFREVLPGPLGVLTTDRLSVYDHLDKNAHQVCWAHLRRDFQAMIDRKDEGSPIGEGLLSCADRLLGHWKRVRDGTLSRKAFQNGPLVELVSEVNGWLGRWESCTSFES